MDEDNNNSDLSKGDISTEMKFSFSNKKSTEKDDNPTPISPIASSVAECIKQVTELLKSK